MGADFAQEIMGPPDYVFGPPPGAEAPGIEVPGAEAASRPAVGTEMMAADAPGMEASLYQPGGAMPHGVPQAAPAVPAQPAPLGAIAPSAGVIAPPTGTIAPPAGTVGWPPPGQTGHGAVAGFPGQQTVPASGYAPKAKRHSRGGRILAIGAAITALAVAAGAVTLLYQHSTNRRAAPRPTPSVASPGTSQLKLASKIDDVKTDPIPITQGEIFPHSALSVDGRQFARVAAAVSRPCAQSARGSFARALMADQCDRVVRATYVDSSKRFVVTAGVAALPTKALAKRANRAKRLDHNVWFAGLNGPAGSGAQSVSKTGGYAYGTVDGRYIIFAYATYTNGQTPTGMGRQDYVVALLSRAFALLAQQPITVRAQS